MKPELSAASSETSVRFLLPNLGAEEGQDWFAITNHAPVLVAARLWALLFAGRDELRIPHGKEADTPLRCEALWPADLGGVPDSTVFPWLAIGDVRAWLNTETAAAYADQVLGAPLVGMPPALAWKLSDKAQAARVSAELGLTPPSLAPLIETLTAEDCANPEVLIPRLEASLAEWPDWTERRFTLKPRLGTSGRGRIGGVDAVDTPAVRSALPRLEERGGALFEPWLKRETDLSISLLVPHARAREPLATVLGSLEMLASPSGLYRGHCGEVDNRGRVFSGHREDESLRGEAAMLVSELQRQGFFGPCGIDAFTYQAGDRSRLRSVVEFNPRITMGIVTLGLIRRALPLVRARLDLSPGSRRGVLMTTFSEKDFAQRDAMLAQLGDRVVVLDLSSPPSTAPLTHHGKNRSLGQVADTHRPMLFFAPDLESLRTAYREATGC